MPILLPFKFRQLSEIEYRDLDYEVMGHAFACQNDLGRLCAESAYQRDLMARLEVAGWGPLRMEQPIQLVHGRFVKRYELDLVVQDAAIYELKAVASLLSEHVGQLLNYLLLTGQRHGKLINFRSAKIQTKFVNRVVTEEQRRSIAVFDAGWRPVSAQCERLRSLMIELLEDWGGHLEISAYRDALIHSFGGERCLAQVPMRRGDIQLGLHLWPLISPTCAFRLTALSTEVQQYRVHLQKMLSLTSLAGIQWINLNQQRCEFCTIDRVN